MLEFINNNSRYFVLLKEIVIPFNSPFFQGMTIVRPFAVVNCLLNKKSPFVQTKVTLPLSQ